MSHVRERVPRVPPRWFVRLAWYAHRALYRVTGGRAGLWRARSNRWGTLRLTTTGRRSNQERGVILGYLEGRSESGHHGDEWLGRWRACLVA